MAVNDTRGAVPLSDLDDFKVADGAPDPRGWDVFTEAGQKVGEVKELLVSPQERRVRYLCIRADRSAGGHETLVPVGAARVDDANDRVIVQSSVLSSLQGVTGYAGGAPSHEYETTLRDRLGIGAVGAGTAGASSYAGEHYDEDRFYGARHQARSADERRLVRMEEELDIQKRRVQAGEVTVRKTVETEHVRESVPVMREEVTIERHAIPADAGLAAGATIGEDSISVPVMEEQVTASKRAVAKEEIVLRTRAVEGQQVVEEDLRRERIDVDDSTLDATHTGRAATDLGTHGDPHADTHRGLRERIADAADSLKDRVDGDPRTKPGRDATDGDLRR